MSDYSWQDNNTPAQGTPLDGDPHISPEDGSTPLTPPQSDDGQGGYTEKTMDGFSNPGAQPDNNAFQNGNSYQNNDFQNNSSFQNNDFQSNGSFQNNNFQNNGSFQNNDFQNNGSFQNNDFQNNSYQNGDNNYRATGSSAMATASLVLGICAILFTCCGGSCVFGVIGIVLALLSRGAGHMNTQAKVGLGLSIGAMVLGVIVSIFFLVSAIASGGLQDYVDSIERYSYTYDYDGSGDYGDLDDYYSDFIPSDETSAHLH